VPLRNYSLTHFRAETIAQHLPKTQAWSTQAARTIPGQEMQPSRTVDGQAHILGDASLVSMASATVTWPLSISQLCPEYRVTV